LFNFKFPPTSRGLEAFNMEVETPDHLEYIFEVDVPNAEEE
jgi:hypothetical protein